MRKELKNSFGKTRVMVTRLFVAMIFSTICISAHGQFVVKGNVTVENSSLPGATVRLLSADSVLLKGIVTDSAGQFDFKDIRDGKYFLFVTMIGYARYYSYPVIVNGNDVTHPPITLMEEARQLDEVVVNVQRDLVINRPDRFVINLENSATSSGNTILEVLQKSPGIVVDRQSNTIRINGRSGVTVTIDGKPLQLSPDALILMLDGMNATGMKYVEVITSPGASFDAEGSGGVINLVTKEYVDHGRNLAIGLVAGVSWAETLGGNFSFVQKTRTITGVVDYSVSSRHNLHEADITESSTEDEFDHRVNAKSDRENITLQQNFRAGIDWNVGKTTISLGMTAYSRDWKLTASTKEMNYAAVDSTTSTNIQIVERNKWQSITASAGMQRRVGQKGELTLGLNYLYYHNRNPSYYRIASFFEQGNVLGKSEIDLQKITPIHFIVSRVDYHHTLRASLEFEGGVKAVASTLDNDVAVQRNIKEVWVRDPDFTSSSDLNERIYSAYLAMKWRVAKGLNIDAGLRYEFTFTDITSPTKGDEVIRSYGYLFPNFSATRSFGPEQDVQLSYGRRIVRPGYNDIAPYVFFWGVRTFSAGNTTLYPAVVSAVTASYHLKQWNISLQYSVSRNEIVTIQPESDDHSNLIFRSQNMKYLKTIGITNSFTANIFSRGTLQANLTAQYQLAESAHLPVNFKKGLPGVNVTLINRVMLPKDFSVEVSATFQSRFISGISEYLPIGSLNAGIQKRVGRNGVLQLAMDDILYTNYWKIRTNATDSNLKSAFVYDWHNQYLRLTYTCSLGKKIRSVVQKESGAEEERGRVN